MLTVFMFRLFSKPLDPSDCLGEVRGILQIFKQVSVSSFLDAYLHVNNHNDLSISPRELAGRINLERKKRQKIRHLRIEIKYPTKKMQENSL